MIFHILYHSLFHCTQHCAQQSCSVCPSLFSVWIFHGAGHLELVDGILDTGRGPNSVLLNVIMSGMVFLVVIRLASD